MESINKINLLEKEVWFKLFIPLAKLSVTSIKLEEVSILYTSSILSSKLSIKENLLRTSNKESFLICRILSFDRLFFKAISSNDSNFEYSYILKADKKICL